MLAIIVVHSNDGGDVDVAGSGVVGGDDGDDDHACEHVSGLTGASEGRSRLTVDQHLIDCFVRSPAAPDKTVFVFVFVSSLIGCITVFLIQLQSLVPYFFWCRIFIFFVGFNQSRTTNLLHADLPCCAFVSTFEEKKVSFFIFKLIKLITTLPSSWTQRP